MERGASRLDRMLWGCSAMRRQQSYSHRIARRALLLLLPFRTSGLAPAPPLLPLTAAGGLCTYKGVPFMTSKGPCTATIPNAHIK